MDGSIKGVQPPKLPQQLSRLHSISDLTKALREETPTSAKADGVNGKSSLPQTRIENTGPITSLEKSLPLAILQSPALMKAEWAWRRLLTEFTQAFGTIDAQGQVPDTEPVPLQMAAETVGTPSADISGPQTHDGASVLTGASQSSRIASPTILTSNTSREEPVHVTGSEGGQNSGKSGNITHVNGFLGPSSALPAAAAAVQSSSASLASAVRVLWDVMSGIAKEAAQAAKTGETTSVSTSALQSLPQSATASGGGALVSFHALQRDHVDHVGSDAVKAWVLEDRLVGVTRSPDAPVIGSGVWISTPQPRDNQTMAVRWQAEHQKKQGPQGIPVHRLRLVVPYDGQPVAIQFVCAYPSVSVHLSTDHPELRRRLSKSSNQVSDVLSAIGWRMDRWSVGAWEEQS